MIANSGYCSRRKAEELIKEGKVTINGEVVTELGIKISSKDVIEIDGIPLKKEEKNIFCFINLGGCNNY